MKVREFPWSPVLAGFSSGVAGFAAAALATGVIHLGSADSCRRADHQAAGTGGIATVAQAQGAPNPCPCCCEGHRTVTAAADDGATLQLTAIAAAPERVGCEDATWAGDPAAVGLTSTAAADDLALGRPIGRLAAVIEPTVAFVEDFAPEWALDPARPVAGRGWSASLASPAAAPDATAAALGGAPGLSSFGSGIGGSGIGGSAGSGAGRALALALTLAPSGTEDSGLVPPRIAALTLAGELTRIAATSTGRAAPAAGLAASEPGDPLANLIAAAVEPAAGGSALVAESTPGGSLAALPSTSTSTSTPAAAGPAAGANPTLAAVPGPSSLALSLVGIGLAGLARRTRRGWSQAGPDRPGRDRSGHELT